MPGSIFELVCPECTRVHEISTGVDYCPEHRQRWHYEQRVCPRCRLIVSRAIGCCLTEPERCRECGGALEPWSGRVFFESVEGAVDPVERVEGPCPGCGETVRESDSRIRGLWD